MLLLPRLLSDIAHLTLRSSSHPSSCIPHRFANLAIQAFLINSRKSQQNYNQRYLPRALIQHITYYILYLVLCTQYSFVRCVRSWEVSSGCQVWMFISLSWLLHQGGDSYQIQFLSPSYTCLITMFSKACHDKICIVFHHWFLSYKLLTRQIKVFASTGTSSPSCHFHLLWLTATHPGSHTGLTRIKTFSFESRGVFDDN